MKNSTFLLSTGISNGYPKNGYDAPKSAHRRIPPPPTARLFSHHCWCSSSSRQPAIAYILTVSRLAITDLLISDWHIQDMHNFDSAFVLSGLACFTLQQCMIRAFTSFLTSMFAWCMCDRRTQDAGENSPGFVNMGTLDLNRIPSHLYLPGLMPS